MNAVELRNVEYGYNGSPNALESVDLVVEEGGFLAVLGPNGGGKSTLMKIIAGLLKPNAGETLLFGKPPAEAARRIGYLPQRTDINPNFPVSVLDVVLMGRLDGTSPPWRKKIWLGRAEKEWAVSSLEKVGMTDFRKRRIGELSGGERQRVLIARALAAKPDLLILDEPTASVDTAGTKKIYELLKSLNRKMTIITVGHDTAIIPVAAKTVACVNRSVHFHPRPELTPEMFSAMYGSPVAGPIPVELLAHGRPYPLDAPQRVIDPHS